MLSTEYVIFLDSIKKQIRVSQYKAVRAVNTEPITLYYSLGKEILKRQKEHGWGAKIIEQLSKDLTEAFPDMKGFSSRNLRRMVLFAKEFSDLAIMPQAVAKLPWGHIDYLMINVNDKKAREFYIEKAVENGWSRAVMAHQIELNLYDRQGKAHVVIPSEAEGSRKMMHQSCKRRLYNYLGIKGGATYLI